MPKPFESPPHSWTRKFACAFAGISWALRTQSSCYVHMTVTLAVIAAGSYFQVSAVQWCLLALAIGSVFCAELLNTALEEMAKLVDPLENPALGRALNVASGGVLCMVLAAVAVGLLIFLPYLSKLWLGAT